MSGCPLRRSIATHGVDPQRGCFVQAYGSQEVDASLLRLAAIGFVKPEDPRMQATVRAVRADLGCGKLLHRYRTEHGEDGFKDGESLFLLCSFWLVDALAMQGDLEEARALYAYLLTLGNDLGLLSEEIQSDTQELLGNFPQAYTHMALINSAVLLTSPAAEGIRHFPMNERIARMAHKRVKYPTRHHSDGHSRVITRKREAA